MSSPACAATTVMWTKLHSMTLRYCSPWVTQYAFNNARCRNDIRSRRGSK